MIEFMFGVLGSIVFWIAFFVIGFFIGTIVLKKVAKGCFDFIVGKKGCPFDKSDTMFESDWTKLIFILVLVYTFWPIILLFLVIGFIINHVFWKLFRKAVKFVDSVIPDIRFEKKVKDEE